MSKTAKQEGEFGFIVRCHKFPFFLNTSRWNSQALALDHLQVIDDPFDALYLRRNRSNARLLLGGLDFAGQISNENGLELRRNWLVTLSRHKYGNWVASLLGNDTFVGRVELFTNGEVLRYQLNDPPRGGIS